MEQDILNDLSQFIGTTCYYKGIFLNYTEGIKYFAERCKCFWLLDIAESVQHLSQIKANNEFLVWRIRVNPDKSFIVDVRADSDKPTLYEQKGTWTDFPLKEYEFYQEGMVLLLKSEH